MSLLCFHAKLWGPKIAGDSTLGISGLPFGSPRIKCHLDVSLMENHKVYYKGESAGFPQARAMVNLMSPSLLVTRLAPKMLQLCTNQLFVLFSAGLYE
jgi:hypothetical protein